MANGKVTHGRRAEEAPDPGRWQDDFFYHGTIVRLSPKKKFGIVRTSSGKELSFSFELVDMYGPVTSPRGLRDGLVVGYDMSWTSSGLKVTKIKTYRRVEGQPVAREANAADAMAEEPLENSDREKS